MKHPIELSTRASQYRIDATTEEWLAYRRGYLDAIDDRDDADEASKRPAPVFIIEGQQSFDDKR